MKHRIAFVTHFCPHYRRPLFEEVSRRLDTDFFFFADERTRHWNRRIPLQTSGDFRRVERRRFTVGDQAVMPGVVTALRPQRYDAVVKCLNGKLMVPLVDATCRLRGMPLVIWTGMWYHPDTRVHRLTRPLTESVYRRADAIVVYGEHVKRFLLETPGVDEEKIFVAGQAVQRERFEGVEPVTGGAAEILFIGQFERRKGIFDLIEAFAGVDDPDARLRLIGNGSLESEIRRAAEADARVEIVGYVPQDELPDQLARSRCLVLPSVTTPLDKEPWGLVVNEAMHAGVPVITTDAVGAAAGGLVVDGRNGYVVPERNPARLGEALRSLAGDADLARAMGDRARSDVDAFSYPRMASAFEQAVDHAIARRD